MVRAYKRRPSPKAKPPAKPELKDLVTAANEVAKTARDVLTAMLVVALTLAATMIAATDEALLRDSAEVFPGLGVKVRLSTIFLLAPVVFTFLHANALLQLHLLAGRMRALDEEMRAQGLEEAARKPWRRLIHGFAFAQLLAGDDSHGGGWAEKLHRVLLAVISWLGITAIPVLLLVCGQVSFIRYQSDAITLTQQIIVSIDIILLAWFHMVTWGQIVKIKLISTIWTAISIFSVTAIAWVVWIQATPPSPHNHPDAIRWGRTSDGVRPSYSQNLGKNQPSFSKWFYRSLRPGLPQISGCLEADAPATSCALVGPANILDRIAVVAGWAWARRYLDLSNRTLVENDAKPDLLKAFVENSILTKAQRKMVALNLQGRTLRFADFTEAQLFYADLRRIRAEHSYWLMASLNGANLTSARLDNSILSKAKLNDAILFDAHLSRSTMAGTVLAGATLEGAHLKESNIGQAQLQGSNLQGADLRASDLGGAVLIGAQLAHADLSGADLQNAKFLNANLFHTKMSGASIEGVNFIGANFESTTLRYLTGTAVGCRAALFHGSIQSMPTGFSIFMRDIEATQISNEKISAIIDRINNNTSAFCDRTPMATMPTLTLEATIYAEIRVNNSCYSVESARTLLDTHQFPKEYDGEIRRLWQKQTCAPVMAVKRERGEAH